MKVLKWEIAETWRGNDKIKHELLENGWEPFASDDHDLIFRRPDGYVEIDKPEKVKVLKWEITNEAWSDVSKSNKLLEEGWEPFAIYAGNAMFRRPVGYIEVELKN